MDRNHGPLLGRSGLPQWSTRGALAPRPRQAASLPRSALAPLRLHSGCRSPNLPLAREACVPSGLPLWLACWAHNPKVRGSKPRSATRALRPPTVVESWRSGTQASSSSKPAAECPCPVSWGLLAGLVGSTPQGRGQHHTTGRVPWVPPPDAVCIHSGLAQWLACWAHNPKVRGSKPRSATRALRPPTVVEPWRSGTQASSSSKPAAECPCPVAPAQ